MDSERAEQSSMQIPAPVVLRWAMRAAVAGLLVGAAAAIAALQAS